jgi:hypothetical protein
MPSGKAIKKSRSSHLAHEMAGKKPRLEAIKKRPMLPRITNFQLSWDCFADGRCTDGPREC